MGSDARSRTRTHTHTHTHTLPSPPGIAAAAALLPHARVAVGPHGANLANAVFCGSGAALVEITLQEPEVRKPIPLPPRIEIINRNLTRACLLAPALARARTLPNPQNKHAHVHAHTRAQFREYEHLAGAVGLLYRPLRGQAPRNAFEDVLWPDPSAVVAAVRAAWRASVRRDEASSAEGGGKDEL